MTATLSYMPSRRSTVLLLILWGCTIVAAGHGVVPLMLLPAALITESSRELLLLAVLAGAPIVIVGAAAVLRLRWLLAIGEALLLAGWGIAMRTSEVWPLTLLTAAPYLYLAYDHAERLINGDVVEAASAR